MVRKPEILILDDSFSALDYATDAALRKAISKAPFKPTTIIVSQRAASVMQAHQNYCDGKRKNRRNWNS